MAPTAEGEEHKLHFGEELPTGIKKSGKGELVSGEGPAAQFGSLSQA